jgi:single-strand DNA-binding protein
VNSVMLVGNLASEVDLRDLGDGKKVASFLLAVDRPTKDDVADFVRVSTWDRQAELCEEYLTKGHLVGIEGHLRTRSWENAEGERRDRVEVTARRVRFISRPGRAETTTAVEEAAMA